MDRFKNNIENIIFSNKTQFIKNRRGNNSNSNFSSNTSPNSNPSIFSNLSFNGEYTTYLLWILLFIIVVIISYLTVMTAKYLSTNCPNKRSWFNYIIKFCYNDVCYPVNTPNIPAPPVVNNVHYLPLNTPNQQNSSFLDKLKTEFKNDSVKKDSLESANSRKEEIKKGGSSIPIFGKKEVFHIANQDYTFEQAKCKCESYNAKLATYDQLVDAYNDGAEWCTYGWSSGQKAYYPTQKCNWEKKSPEDRLKCGNPGLNGGFFADPYLKFGVNCYGKKPKGKVSKLKDQVCNNGGNYCELPQNFGASNRLETDEISPFNSDKWNN